METLAAAASIQKKLAELERKLDFLVDLTLKAFASDCEDSDDSTWLASANESQSLKGDVETVKVCGE